MPHNFLAPVPSTGHQLMDSACPRFYQSTYVTSSHSAVITLKDPGCFITCKVRHHTIACLSCYAFLVQKAASRTGAQLTTRRDTPQHPVAPVFAANAPKRYASPVYQPRMAISHLLLMGLLEFSFQFMPRYEQQCLRYHVRAPVYC